MAFLGLFCNISNNTTHFCDIAEGANYRFNFKLEISKKPGFLAVFIKYYISLRAKDIFAKRGN